MTELVALKAAKANRWTKARLTKSAGALRLVWNG
ncbi:hypothetical protein AB7M47_004910 [Bradyrhizobium elkanii]